MKTDNKNKTTYRIILLYGAILFCMAFFVFRCVQATDDDSISSISDSDSGTSDETQQKLDELQRKAEVYRQIIDIKKKQDESLSNQLSIADSNIQEVQAQIDLGSQQIEDLNNQIIRLEDQIKEKNALIESQKKLLANILQAYYEVNQSGLLTAYLSNGNIASFIVTKDRLSQTSDKIKDLVDSIIEIKNDLSAQSADLDDKKSKIVDANQALQDQNNNLASMKQQKQTLLSQTQGEEERYEQLLANVEQQKQQLLDIDQFFAASGLSVDSYPKPDSKYFASTDWYYSQRDPEWGNDNIGNTKTLIKSYGCALTAVAMVFEEHGVSIDPGKLANKPIFSGDLIDWYDSSDWEKNWPVPDSYGYAHGNINWSVIDSKISKGIPVIVYIKKSNGGGGHYVVIHHKDANGKYVVHDPYFGANIFLDTSRALIGAMGKSSSTTVDQMIIYE
jgi:peptidoglycan hydrolase CwlO-like protein